MQLDELHDHCGREGDKAQDGELAHHLVHQRATDARIEDVLFQGVDTLLVAYGHDDEADQETRDQDRIDFIEREYAANGLTLLLLLTLLLRLLALLALFALLALDLDLGAHGCVLALDLDLLHLGGLCPRSRS